jgi:CBS domain-containing protein
VLAEIVTRVTLHESLMTETLTRRRVAVPGDHRPDVMATTHVGEIMSTDVVTVAAADSLGDARRRFVEGRHSACPLVDDEGRCVGIVTRSDLLAAGDEDDEATVGTMFGGDVVGVAATDTVLTALQRMLDASADHLPVLDDDRLVGICTRIDVLRSRQRALAADRPEPGWLARLRLGEA